LTGLIGTPISFSGRVYAPDISLYHATQILKKLAPSKWKTAKYSEYDSYPEAEVAIKAFWEGAKWIYRNNK